MAFLDVRERPATLPSPQLLLGATSPLWGYFAVTTASGMAFWMMTRWVRATNLEALLGAAAKTAVLPVALAEPTVEAVALAVEETVDAVEVAVLESLPEAPVGGESAPISPAAGMSTAPVPTIEATADPLPDALPKARLRKPSPADGLDP